METPHGRIGAAAMRRDSSTRPYHLALFPAGFGRNNKDAGMNRATRSLPLPEGDRGTEGSYEDRR